MSDSSITILYTNYKGETALRKIVPDKIWFGSTQRHPDGCWLLDAFDFDKKAKRSFAMKDIKERKENQTRE